MATAGIEIVGSTPAEFGTFFRAEKTSGRRSCARPARRSTRTRCCSRRCAALKRIARAIAPAPSARAGSRASSTGPTRAACGSSSGRSSSTRPKASPRCCSCTARRWRRSRRSTSRCPGRPDSSVMDWFAQRGFVCWTRRHGRLWPLGQERATSTATSPTAPTISPRRPITSATTRGVRDVPRPTASRRARCARHCSPQRHPDRVARLALDAFVWTGEGAPTLEQRRKKLPEFMAQKRRPIDRAFVYSIFERDHPDTADKRVGRRLCRRDPRARRLDAQRNLHRHVLAVAGRSSRRDSRCRRWCCAASTTASRRFDDLIEFFKRLPQSRQAVHRHAPASRTQASSRRIT